MLYNLQRIFLTIYVCNFTLEYLVKFTIFAKLRRKLVLVRSAVSHECLKIYYKVIGFYKGCNIFDIKYFSALLTFFN